MECSQLSSAIQIYPDGVRVFYEVADPKVWHERALLNKRVAQFPLPFFLEMIGRGGHSTPEHCENYLEIWNTAPVKRPLSYRIRTKLK